MKRIKSVVIFTHLPLKRYGNRSLEKTIEMFVERDISVYIFSSNKIDYNGPFRSNLFIKSQSLPFNILNLTECKFVKVIKRIIKRVGSKIITNYKFSSPKGIVLLGPSFWGALVEIIFLVEFTGIMIVKGLINLKVLREADVIYGYEIFGTYVGYLFSKILRKPLIKRYQGTVVYPYISNGFFKRIKMIIHILSMKLSACLIVMADDGTKGDKVLRALKVDLSKVLFIRNGIEIPTFLKITDIRSKIGLKKSDKILLMVSRLYKWKRVDRGLVLLYEVLKYRNDVYLLIIGDGDERENLIKMSKKLGIQKNVVFLGNVPHNQVFNFYKEADIFLSLYDHSNLNNSLIEAMNMGVCCVTLNDESIKGIIENGKNGILIDLNNLNESVNILINLLENDEYRMKVGIKAKLKAQKEFLSWQKRKEIEMGHILKCC